MLDALTGCPVPEDIMLYAIPVCAPYTAISSYKLVHINITCIALSIIVTVYNVFHTAS